MNVACTGHIEKDTWGKGSGRMRAANGLAVAALLAVLCSCGPRHESASDVRAEAAKLHRPMPGRYAQTIAVTRFDVPGMDPQELARLRQMMERTRLESYCLTKAQSDAGFKAMFARIEKGGQCTYSRFAVNGDEIDAQMDCSSAGGRTAAIKMNGTIGATGSDVLVNMDQSGLPAPARKVSMVMHMVTRRTGECGGAAKPRDGN